MTADLGQLMAHDMAFNKEIVEGGDKLIPRWVARNAKGESFVLVTPWGGEEEKLAILHAMRVFFIAHDITSYTLSAEVWGVRIEGEDPEAAKAAMDVPPSEHPDRFEMINVLGVDQHGSMLCSAEITRDGDKITVGPPDCKAQRVKGRMSELLPRPSDPVMPEDVKAEVRKRFAGFGVAKNAM